MTTGTILGLFCIFVSFTSETGNKVIMTVKKDKPCVSIRQENYVLPTLPFRGHSEVIQTTSNIQLCDIVIFFFQV